MSPVHEYRPPAADGDPDSSDPHFRARSRACGKCQRPFETTAKYRYYCPVCRAAPARKHTPIKEYSTGRMIR